ncbi:hypothetical protein BDW59DRAFT_153797 [Aspergillus cavernicola]|uniref:Uncharacterized protein n=1 Tax=Aspergillus cavernicola TaxID=176166 RepID=A0ABR4HJC5_9EURO
MRLQPSLPPSSGNPIVLTLLLCIVVSAISFDSILRDLHHDILSRSLPGSLALAPEGAVGSYRPPPGLIIYGHIPATVGGQEGTVVGSTWTAENTGDTDTDTGYGSAKAMAATDGSEEPSRHIPSVSEIDAMTAAAQAGSASRDVVRWLASLVVSMFVSLLHL